ncbi:hypothetical protein O9Z70_06175 [Devosia sp. YIM 151766]|uniref:hypothetical protein n=1 Tax=Devosia sp. YIM 151766 TaxID=3017325 RepID=UPI00255C936E|nr:hypothetical protein [Devosia sp. YIM 151766]WIY54103.1 hypothetical protein O9Z70_06175 [Devosia sp. YIM 151766]
MTSDEADQRIILSRHTLRRYSAMVAAGELPVMDMGLMNDELDLLERIAEKHPSKVEKIRALGEEWLAMMAQIRAKLN